MTSRRAAAHTDGGEAGASHGLTAAAIAELTGGALHGDASARVIAVAPLDRAITGQLSFCASSRYAEQLASTGASVVLLVPELADAATAAAARVVVPRPHDAMLGVLPKLYHFPVVTPGIHPTAVIGRGAQVGDGASIGPYVVIGAGARVGARAAVDAHVTVGDGVQLGDDVRLYPHVTVYAGSRLGNRVTVHAGAVVGSDGFGYVSRASGHEKIPHVGRCILEDDVEVGAGTTIDRGSIDDTVIGAGTKIDNLVMIAHNVRIGRLCLIAAQAGISGSVRIEDACVIGGQAGFQGHHTIGKGARIGAQSGVFGDVPPGEIWSGYPARPHREALRAQAALFKVSGLMRRLEALLGDEDA